MDIHELEEKTRLLMLTQEDYEAKSKIAKDSYAVLEGLKLEYIAILEALDRNSFECENVARITKVETPYVATPKTPDEKSKLFQWIREHLGEDGYMAYLGVNSQTLNSLYKQQLEETGNPMLAQDMGLGVPTTRVTLRINRR